jgi:hypothetical protein
VPPDLIPPDLLPTVVLAASSVLLGVVLPLGGALAIVGVVRGFAEVGWRTLVAGLLLLGGAVAAAAFLRAWAATLGDISGPERTAAVVFTAVTPIGVILAAVFVAVALIRLALDRRRERG